MTIPGRGQLALAYLALDVNGTLSLDGSLLIGVEDRLAQLREVLEIHLLTADTYGRQAEIDARLGLTAVRLRAGEPEAEQKAAYVQTLGPDRVVAVGNGSNDAGMLREAALGIAVIGFEGLSMDALKEAAVVAPDILAALDLLLHPRRLAATLRR